MICLCWRMYQSFFWSRDEQMLTSCYLWCSFQLELTQRGSSKPWKQTKLSYTSKNCDASLLVARCLSFYVITISAEFTFENSGYTDSARILWKFSCVPFSHSCVGVGSQWWEESNQFCSTYMFFLSFPVPLRQCVVNTTVTFWLLVCCKIGHVGGWPAWHDQRHPTKVAGLWDVSGKAPRVARECFACANCCAHSHRCSRM